MATIHQLLLGILTIFGGVGRPPQSASEIDRLAEDLKVSLKKSDRERLLEDRRRIAGDLRVALDKTKQALNLQ